MSKIIMAQMAFSGGTLFKEKPGRMDFMRDFCDVLKRC